MGALVAVLAATALLAASRMSRPPSFDGLNTYMPLARRLLSEGAALLFHPDSITAAPLSYLWPALLGAQIGVVRWANVGVFLAAIALVFFAVRAAHSLRAAILAGLLLGTAPALQPYVADLLTEPLFIFFMAAWVASLVAVLRGYRWQGAIAGGVALACAALTRPSIAYFPLVGLALFAMRYRFAPRDERVPDAAIAGLHALALALCGAYVLRNALAFGYPSIATGSGAALFLGANALVDGFDPVYYGLDYDTGAVTQAHSHLSIEGDRLLRGAGLAELAATPWPIVLEMWARKALAFVFMPSIDVLGENTLLVRSWRITAVVFGAAAVALRYRSHLVAALAALVAYSIAVHLPALMHHRYSAGLLELPLAILAAIGLLEVVSRAGLFAGLAALAAAGSLAGSWLMREPGPYAPHPERSPHQVVWTWNPEASAPPRVDHATAAGPSSVLLVPPGGAIEFDVRDAPLFHPWDFNFVTLNVATGSLAPGAGCTAMTLRFKGVGDPAFSASRKVRVPLAPSRNMKPITVGAAIPLAIKHEGVLRAEFECATETRVDLGTISIAAPRRATYYLGRHLEGLKEGGKSR